MHSHLCSLYVVPAALPRVGLAHPPNYIECVKLGRAALLFRLSHLTGSDIFILVSQLSSLFVEGNGKLHSS